MPRLKSRYQANRLTSLVKIVTILCPPFTIFVVTHARFVSGRLAYLSENTRLRKGGRVAELMVRTLRTPYVGLRPDVSSKPFGTRSA